MYMYMYMYIALCYHTATGSGENSSHIGQGARIYIQSYHDCNMHTVNLPVEKLCSYLHLACSLVFNLSQSHKMLLNYCLNTSKCKIVYTFVAK